MRVFFIITGIFLFTMVAGGVSAEIVNGIAAKVGTDIITIHEFNRTYEQMKKNALMRGSRVSTKKEVMNQLIDNLLIQKEAEKRGIIVTEEELNKVIENIKKQRNLNDEEFESELKRENITLKELKDQYRRDFLKTRLINQMASSRVYEIGEDEIKNFYEDPANKRLFIIPSMVKLSELFIQVPADASYQEALDFKNRAHTIYEEIRNGGNFEELVKTYSEAPNKDDEGYLGSFTQEQMLTFVKPADVSFIFSLDRGDITTPIRLQDGYYIFKIRDKDEKKLLTLEEARENIKSYLLRMKGDDLFQSWLLKKRDLTKIHFVLSME